MRSNVLPTLLLGFAVASCGGNTSSDFPDGLAPLEDNQAPAPAAIAGDPYPETISVASGKTDDYSWAHGKGYVHANILDTWAALKVPAVCVDRRKVDTWSYEENVDAKYAYSCVLHNTVHGMATIDFDNTWRHGVATGTASAPTVVAARYKKTWGSTFIDLMEGSVILRRIDDKTTLVEMEEHLKAYMQGPDTAVSTISDFYSSLLAQVHGKPLPTY